MKNPSENTSALVLQVGLKQHPPLPLTALRDSLKHASSLVMSVVTRSASFASHLPIIALLTSNRRIKQPIVPQSVSTRTNDPYRYWKLWHHPEDIDSIIACIMWRDRHLLRAMDIAAGLAFVQPADCWGINAEDVTNFYRYLEKHQEIPENPFADWQSMRDMRTHPH